jgi:hypothetical protein
MQIGICALLRHNAASSGNPLPTFRDVSVPSSRVKKSKKIFFLDFLTLEDGTHTFSRNVGKGLPLDAALYARREEISYSPDDDSRYRNKMRMCSDSPLKRRNKFMILGGVITSILNDP